MAPVLVVDDDFHVLEILTVYLQSRGHQVLCARDGESALALLGGFDLVEYVRLLRRVLPVAMMSGSWTAAERARASALGAARLYAKPLDLAQLARDVEDLAPGNDN